MDAVFFTFKEYWTQAIDFLRPQATRHNLVIFFGGFACCSIITYEYICKINNLTRCQLLGRIATLTAFHLIESNPNYNKMGISQSSQLKQMLPYARTRPSNEAIFIHKLGWGFVQDYTKFKTPLQYIKNFRFTIKINDIFAVRNLPKYVTKKKYSFKTVPNITYTEFHYPGASADNGIIIYLPGSAFTVKLNNYNNDMLVYMAKFTGCLPVMLRYGVSPEYTIEEIFDHCWHGYLEILEKFGINIESKIIIKDNDNSNDNGNGNNNGNINGTNEMGLTRPVFIVGTSAGGTLLLLLLEKIKKIGNCKVVPFPTGVTLLAPVMDLTSTLPSMIENRTKSAGGILIGNELAVGIIDRQGNKTDKYKNQKHDKELLEYWSPLKRDLSGIECDIYWIAGLHEDLIDDSREGVKKLKKEMNLDKYEIVCRFNEYIPHTAAFIDIPECLYEISILCDWMNKKSGHVHWNL